MPNQYNATDKTNVPEGSGFVGYGSVGALLHSMPNSVGVFVGIYPNRNGSYNSGEGIPGVSAITSGDELAYGGGFTPSGDISVHPSSSLVYDPEMSVESGVYVSAHCGARIVKVLYQFTDKISDGMRALPLDPSGVTETYYDN